MTRVLGLIGILVIVGACAAGSWLAIRPPLAPFLAPGATKVQVVNVSIWEQQISYHVSGPLYAWYWVLIHTLEKQEWTLRTALRPDLAGTSYAPIIRLQFEPISLGFVVDEAVVEPDYHDPNLARIHFYRRIVIPWR
jgi:hypothetical protein